MKKINFEQIGKHLTVLDTDLIDIGRRTLITNPDGTIGETNPQIPLYRDVPCHISFIKSDNPDSDTVDTNPIITGLRINCDLSVDLEKDDYIVAKKMADNGTTILETYYGTIGFPMVTQSRKSAEMQMKTGV